MQCNINDPGELLSGIGENIENLWIIWLFYSTGIRLY